jgi:3'(2'), 5'-bisphosphate nucleotidase
MRAIMGQEAMPETAEAAADLALVDALVPAVIEAGRVILDVRRRGHVVERKADLSPVTEADRLAEAILVKALCEHAPDVPVIAEEAVDAGHLPDVGRSFFLVDPLDGTKEFVNGGGDFTVNVGLIRDRVPVVGIVYAPATGALYCGVAGGGAWRHVVVDSGPGPRMPVAIRPASGPLRIVASRSHRTFETDAYIARFEVESLVSAGSSLKFCLVAAGEADLYPRMGTTMQWDTAAGDAVVRAAGGKVVTMEGSPLLYGPGDAPGAAAFANPWFIVAGGVEPL